MLEDEVNEEFLSDKRNMKIVYLAPMAKREYKNHQNGHGIEVWACEDCKREINNINVRCQKPRFCTDCSIIRRKEKSRERYWRRKNV